MIRQNLIFNSLFDNYSIYDYDNNGYNTVIIGDQEWTTQNLKTTHYANGDIIPYVSETTEWMFNASDGAYCEYNNNINAYKNPYGYLYNWYTINNDSSLVYFKKNGIQELGWRVPTLDDVSTLSFNIGGNTVAGGKLKIADTTYWNAPNTGATNDYGFNLLGGGWRSAQNGNFVQMFIEGLLLTSNEYDENNCEIYYAKNDAQTLVLSSSFKKTGAAIRCVKDI